MLKKSKKMVDFLYQQVLLTAFGMGHKNKY